MTFDFRMVRKLGPVSNKKQDEYITNASLKCKNILLNIQKKQIFIAKTKCKKLGMVEVHLLTNHDNSRFHMVAQIMDL
jgi:hypothetical protein